MSYKVIVCSASVLHMCLVFSLLSLELEAEEEKILRPPGCSHQARFLVDFFSVVVASR